MRGGDLEEVSLGQGQVARDVLAQGLQRVAVAEHRERERSWTLVDRPPSLVVKTPGRLFLMVTEALGILNMTFRADLEQWFSTGGVAGPTFRK